MSAPSGLAEFVNVAARKLYGSFRDRGLATTARYTAMSVLEQVEARQFDRRYCVETRGEHSAPDDCRGYFYRGSPIRLAKRSLASLQIDHSKFVFVDLGCGKGRVLFLAADYPYKRIIGVELSRELQGTALSNISAFRACRPASPDITFLSRDAAQFVLPDDPLVIYMFNSFPASVLLEILANLRASLEASPRPLLLLYSNPYLHPILDRSGFLHRLQVIHVPFVGPSVKRYRVMVYASAESHHSPAFSTFAAASPARVPSV